MTVNKEAPKRKSEKVRFTKISKQTVKDQEMMALGTVQEIYDFYGKRVDDRKSWATSSF